MSIWIVFEFVIEKDYFIVIKNIAFQINLSNIYIFIRYNTLSVWINTLNNHWLNTWRDIPYIILVYVTPVNAYSHMYLPIHKAF